VEHAHACAGRHIGDRAGVHAALQSAARGGGGGAVFALAGVGNAFAAFPVMAAAIAVPLLIKT
jgi:uncharacterized membrane protein